MHMRNKDCENAFGIRFPVLGLQMSIHFTNSNGRRGPKRTGRPRYESSFQAIVLPYINVICILHIIILTIICLTTGRTT